MDLVNKYLTEGKQSRPLSTIAREIYQDWKKVNFAAKPYLDAMSSLNFLSNARSWTGPKAKEIKKELKAMMK